MRKRPAKRPDPALFRRVILVLSNGIRRVEDYPDASAARAAYDRALASRAYLQVHIEAIPPRA